MVYRSKLPTACIVYNCKLPGRRNKVGYIKVNGLAAVDSNSIIVQRRQSKLQRVSHLFSSVQHQRVCCVNYARARGECT